jgi:hypothetical protein
VKVRVGCQWRLCVVPRGPSRLSTRGPRITMRHKHHAATLSSIR